MQGLRGLAARAAATSTAGLRPLGAAPAGSARSADAAIAPMQQAPARDDEQLVEQLARLLKREAERDGIDVSDVLP